MSASRVEEREKLPFPWGRYAGLLTATLVMFVGAALGNEPLTILKRSFFSGISIACIFGFGMGLIQIVDSEKRRSRRQSK